MNAPSVITIHRTADATTVHSPRVCRTAALFGLDVDDESRVTIVPECEIPLPRPGVVFVTGPSGSGKSSVLRELASQAAKAGWHVLCDESPGENMLDRALVDLFDHSLEYTLSLLAAAGLAEARLGLRTADQLSDGQRARLALARVFDRAEREATLHDRSIMLVFDEFGATLDRTTARIVAAGVRRWIDRTQFCFIAATAHDDLLEALSPDVLVYKPHGEAIEVHERSRAGQMENERA